MNKVAITGASGFVGRNLLPYLQDRYLETLPLSRENGLNYEDVDESFLNAQSVRGIVHLAGKAHDLRKSKDGGAYYHANTELTKHLFDAFIKSDTEVFIYLSSVKAAADTIHGELTEDLEPRPVTDYGRSKLMAEQYLEERRRTLPSSKRVYILRPCMVHGPGNKGNLNLLFAIVRKGIPYPLAAFNNKRSFLRVENLCFVIQELIVRNDIASGIYNVADDIALSTNRIVEIMSETMAKKPSLLFLNKTLVKTLAKMGDFFRLPLNSERLKKLTENYIVSNEKLKQALCKPLPVNSEDGLRKTFESFHKNQ